LIRQYELIDKILAYNKDADVALLNRAYVFSMKAHGNQKRASGEPYLTHPLEVAEILADLKLDEASIATGLLHDTIEDTLATTEEIRELFGSEVADLVEGVTKLSKITFDNKKIEQVENYRKMFLAMSKDIRVLLVKLADRLHNMRTIEHKKEDSKRRTAQETMDIFVPLADRIGLHRVKTELEDICFKALHPEEYAKVIERLHYLKTQDNPVPRVIQNIQDELRSRGIKAEVTGREKSPYSIYRKMHRKNLTFDQLTDVVAYRITVDDVRTCYEVLGLIHSIYKAIPGRFKDYISNPKPNGYQSLHTSIIGPYGNREEIQIRTAEMHEIAEAGVAAHWVYKQAGKAVKNEEKEGAQYKWLKSLIELLQDTDDPDDFREKTRLDLFSDQVFVYTPKGDLISLPKGSTPLDFAYDVHSDVGHKCQSAKVNGRIVPLRAKLQNGDVVEIITSKAQKPTAGWREFVVTAKARNAINRYLRAQATEEQTLLGKEILEKASKRDDVKLTEKELQASLASLQVDSIPELYMALAQGRIFPKQVLDVVAPSRNKQSPAEELTTTTVKTPTQTESSDDGAVLIDGFSAGMAMHMAGCCNPIPGEPIVGIINTGHGITIHTRYCRNLDQFAETPERWLSVKWNSKVTTEGPANFTARLRISMFNRAGAMSELTTALFNLGVNISDFRIEAKAADYYDVRCDVDVKNMDHFRQMMTNVRNLKCVNHVERIQG